MQEYKIEMFKVYASSPDKKVRSIETTDPLKAEQEYLKKVQSSEEEPCTFIIRSNHPEVPNANLFIGPSDKSPFYREQEPARRLSMWGDPERSKVITGEKWVPPTVWQCKAMRQRILDAGGGEVPLRLLALKVGYEKRSFTFFFAENNNRPIPYLVWSKLLEATGKHWFKLDSFSLMPFSGA